MESDKLNTEKVLPRFNATRNRESDFALISDQFVDPPYAAIKTIMVDLEPFQSSNVALKSVRYFSPEESELVSHSPLIST
jgi:hypothetical protein